MKVARSSGAQRAKTFGHAPAGYLWGKLIWIQWNISTAIHCWCYL